MNVKNAILLSWSSKHGPLLCVLVQRPLEVVVKTFPAFVETLVLYLRAQSAVGSWPQSVFMPVH